MSDKHTQLVEERCAALAQDIIDRAAAIGLSLSYVGRREDHNTTGGREHWRLVFEMAPTSQSADAVLGLFGLLKDNPLLIVNAGWRHNPEGEADPQLGLRPVFLASVSGWADKHSALQGDWVLSRDGRVVTLADVAREDSATFEDAEEWVQRAFSGLDSRQQQRA